VRPLRGSARRELLPLCSKQEEIAIVSDASDEQLEKLLAITRRDTPVFDSVSNPVPIDATVECTQ
jgi:hypothetical protein